MRESSPERRIVCESFRSRVRQKRAIKLILLLASCLLLTACPADGGDLLPLAQNEGTDLVTTKFKDDTLRFSRQGLIVTASGFWSVHDSATSIILTINNTNISSETAPPLTIDFNGCELVNNDSREKLSLRSVSEENGSGLPNFIASKVVTVEGGQKKQFVLNFGIQSASGSTSRDPSGETVTLRIPAELKSNAPARLDIVFTFRYAERRR